MTRRVSSVLGGALVTYVAAMGTDVLAFQLLPDSIDDHHPAVLASLLVLDLAAFVIGGYLTARWATRAEIAHAFVMGMLVLLLAIATTSTVHDTAPLWWHVVLLVAVVPAAVAGGSLRAFERLPRED